MNVKLSRGLKTVALSYFDSFDFEYEKLLFILMFKMKTLSINALYLEYNKR